MSTFETALAYVLRNEGGFSNDPYDPGGATKFGITQATLSRWRGQGSISVQTVLDLSQVEAGDIYRAYYWRPMGCEGLTQPAIATALFDCSVLFGVGTISVLAQRALRECGHPELALDGHIGPKTTEALNSVSPALFVKSLYALLTTRINDIVVQRPASAKFKVGWGNRLARMLTLV